MMFKSKIWFLFMFFSFLSCGQTKSTEKSLLKTEPKSADYYNRYDYYAHTFEARNEMIFTVDIFVWQDNQGKGNYQKNVRNDSILQASIGLVDNFYTKNAKPTFKPLPDVIDYETTKIRFRLGKIFYERDSECINKGKTTSYADGVFLNEKANSLYPERKRNIKIHVTAVESKHTGYATFPSSDKKHQHFVVTFNKKSEENMGDGAKSADVAWGFAKHLAHEFGHNFNLTHTYDGVNCDEKSADYLDDVFGSSKNNSKVCPQDGGWHCNYNLPSTTCTNNIMGGNKSAGYFSPKQIQRMHRALTLGSIRNYAVAHQFNRRKHLLISENEIWTNDIKLYNSIKIEEGATLTIKNTIEFVPEAEIIIQPGGTLIVDGGLLTNERFYEKEWKGIEIKRKKIKKEFIEGTFQLINGGKVENNRN